MASPTLCIVGPGAIGGWLAARLALAGNAVSVLARGATLERIAGHGIQLHGGGGAPVQTARVRAAATAAALGPHDVVILTVKSQSLPALAPSLVGLLHAGTCVVPAVNGLPWWFFLQGGRRLASVDPQGGIEAALPLAQVLGMSVYVACHQSAPGVVHHDGGKGLVVGEPVNSTDTRRAEPLAACLREAGIATQVSADIRADIWHKLLGNACFNPASLLTGAHMDEMIDDPGLHALFVRMAGEALAIGRAAGIAVVADPAERIAQARRLGHIKTSMLQDLEAGRSVELDAILGALVETAHAEGVPAPALQGVLALARMRARLAAGAAP